MYTYRNYRIQIKVNPYQISLSLSLSLSLNTLHSFCKKRKLYINLKKLHEDNDIPEKQQQKTRRSQNPEIYFNDSLVAERTQEYTYLGVKLTSSGNFTSAQELREKAMHAFFGIRKYTNINKLPPQLASKIFDTMISPILMYNSEVWGAYEKFKLTHCQPSHPSREPERTRAAFVCLHGTSRDPKSQTHCRVLKCFIRIK